MTDAAHLLTDVGSMSVSLFSLWVSTRPPTKTMNFGWHRSGELGEHGSTGAPQLGRVLMAPVLQRCWARWPLSSPSGL